MFLTAVGSSLYGYKSLCIWLRIRVKSILWFIFRSDWFHTAQQSKEQKIVLWGQKYTSGDRLSRPRVWLSVFCLEKLTLTLTRESFWNVFKRTLYSHLASWIWENSCIKPEIINADFNFSSTESIFFTQDMTDDRWQNPALGVNVSRSHGAPLQFRRALDPKGRRSLRDVLYLWKIYHLLGVLWRLSCDLSHTRPSTERFTTDFPPTLFPQPPSNTASDQWDYKQDWI